MKDLEKRCTVDKIRGSGFFAVQVLMDSALESLGRLLSPTLPHLVASWANLGPLGRVLEALGRFLGSTGGLLDAVWRVLSASWNKCGSLGRYLALLGRHWAEL